MSGIYSNKILLIENDRFISDPLVELLTRLGYAPLLCDDPSTVQNEILRSHPDIVVIDIGMREFDGFAVLESLRGNADTLLRETPVIIASNTGDIVEIARAIKLNIKDYFVKGSFDPEQVAKKIIKHIGVPRSNDTKRETQPENDASTAMTKILIIEDDKFLRDLAEQKLAKEHLQVSIAADGEQGVAVAERELPDIILLDILLPGIDGFEVLRRIRSNPTLRNTHIVMLSNFGQREDIEKALGAGADEFLVKANYTLDEIVEQVKKIISKPRLL